MKKLFFFISCLLISQFSHAVHISGGDIRYEFNGTNYDVILTLYNVCGTFVSNGYNPNNETIKVWSITQNRYFTHQAVVSTFETVRTSCPDSLNLCINPNTGTVPIYMKTTYKATVSLPVQASDWVFSWEGCCRKNEIVNGGAGRFFYIETRLNNSVSANSNPLMTTIPSYYISLNDTANIPLQSIDLDDDSVVCELVEPMSDSVQSVGYYPPYSKKLPLGYGGICKIDNGNTLVVKTVNQGMYSIAIRVKEYRNGTLVGSFIRDILIVAVSTLNPLDYPLQHTSNAQEVYTCPGQSANFVMLKYSSPSANDSVFIDVEFPQFTGWNFATNTINSKETAQTSISWSTPSSVNPALLPYFLIKAHVRTNECPGNTVVYNLLVRTRDCSVDSVWAGDANSDNIVNIYDPLAVAVAEAKTGATRPNASNNWNAQDCDNWSFAFAADNTNMKHADCDGNGIVNNSDYSVITQNYTKQHGDIKKLNAVPTNDWYFDMSNIILSPGNTVSIPIMLGDSNNVVTDVFGVATRILIGGLKLVTPPTITYANSWISTSQNALNYTYLPSTTIVDWAFANNNRFNKSGQGEIGRLNFTVPKDAAFGTAVTLQFDAPVIVDYIGIPRYGNSNNITRAWVQFPESVQDVSGNIQDALIIPNPSENVAQLKFSLAETTSLQIVVRDITGKVIWNNQNQYGVGEHMLSLPSADLPAGMYMLEILPNEGSSSVLKWIKQ